jgi:hypothetical protein
MPTSLCEMIHQRGLPREGMALHVEAVLGFRLREAKSDLSSKRAQRNAAAAFSGPGKDAAASCALRTEIPGAGIQPKQ